MKALALTAALLISAKTGNEIPTGKFKGKVLLVFEYRAKDRSAQVVTGDGFNNLEVLELRAREMESIRLFAVMDREGEYTGQVVKKPFSWERDLILNCPIEEIINSKNDLEGIFLISPGKCHSIISEKLM